MSGILQTLFLGAAAAVKDAYFNLTTLLLNTSSTNGAQNNTFLDSSTNNFTITRNGNTTQGTFTPFSQTGWSGYFDGASDYIQFTNSDFSVSTGDFTAEWFMFITSDKAQVGIMTAATNSNLTIGYGSGSANARQPYVEWGGAGAYIGTMSNYMNTWVHICVMRSSGTVYTFQNGTLLSSASKSASVGATTNMVIGTNAGDVGGQGVPGYLSNVRFATSAIYSTSGFTAPTLPLTRTSQSATNVKFLTLQSNRFLDSNGVNIPASSPLAITTYNDVSVQAFSPFAPTAAYDTAVVGGSGYFDGTGDYLSTPSATALQLTAATAFTIEGWAYPTSFPSTDHGIIGKRAGGAVEWQFFFKNDKTLHLYTGLGDYGSGTTISGFNQWVHCAVTWDLTTLRFFINGVLCSTTHTGILFNIPSTADVTVGADYAGAELWNGYLSGVRLVKGTAVYTSTFTPPTAPPTAITNTSLLTNFTNAGIYDSTAKNVLETVGNAQVSTTQAKWGTTSMVFNGTSDYIVNPSSALVSAWGTGDFTVEGWYYSNNIIGTPPLWLNSTSNSDGMSACYVYATGSVAFGKIGVNEITSATGVWSNSQWNHLAVVRSGATVYIYVNGVSVASGAAATYVETATVKPITLGRNYQTASTYYNGYIDDFRVTKGYARYPSGTTFTPPAAAFGTQ
jgi:hypothetical protein